MFRSTKTSSTNGGKLQIDLYMGRKKSISFLGHTQAINWLHFRVNFKLLIACQVLADGCADGPMHWLCSLGQYFGHPLPGKKVIPLHCLLFLLVQILSKGANSLCSTAFSVFSALLTSSSYSGKVFQCKRKHILDILAEYDFHNQM